ncbi:MAG: hypothetical protein ACO4AI_15505 [Prochlorothrix sp.]|nr:hypothetical protein [Prochlorothrix sp.]
MLNLDLQPRIWTSLILTAFFSFLAPVLLLGGLWFCLYGLGQIIPPLAPFTDSALEQLRQFLAVFGTGDSWQGILVLGAVGATVGVLFETYALSLSRSLR